MQELFPKKLRPTIGAEPKKVTPRRERETKTNLHYVPHVYLSALASQPVHPQSQTACKDDSEVNLVQLGRVDYIQVLPIKSQNFNNLLAAMKYTFLRAPLQDDSVCKEGRLVDNYE